MFPAHTRAGTSNLIDQVTLDLAMMEPEEWLAKHAGHDIVESEDTSMRCRGCNDCNEIYFESVTAPLGVV